MDHNSSSSSSYRLPSQLPPSSSFSTPFPPLTAQPPVQIPFSDPFHTSRDPFLPSAHARRGSIGVLPRAWPTQGNNNALPPHHSPPTPSQHTTPQSLPPLPSANGLTQMPLPFDTSRRHSLGGVGSSPQYPGGPHEPALPPPPSFPTRNMPPPSPPHMLPPTSTAPTHLASAPRGPPTTSPFAGVRDLASYRHGSGMSILSMLGGSSGDERKVNSSPRASAAAAGPSPTPTPMRPPSPGRVRSSSMREGLGRGEESSGRFGIFGESRNPSALHDLQSEPRRDGLFGSPQLQRESAHSFRAFRPESQEQRPITNGASLLGRPSSQPIELTAPRSGDEPPRHELDGRFGSFRQFSEAPTVLPRSEATPRHDSHPFQNGVTSAPRERDNFGSPLQDRDRENRQVPARFQPSMFSTPMREDHAGLFRPAYQHGPDSARESIESRSLHDSRRELPRSTPPTSELPHYERSHNGFIDRPMTFEEHQRAELAQRKESDGSVHRMLFNISPELSRKGRDSPLPQAVQGAQPRHVGPGGDNPGIKMEFGRMFSGLGSGVGSATPTAGQSANGTTTPSRMSPMRQAEEGDLIRTAVDDLQAGKDASKGSVRGGKRGGRRAREEERLDIDGRATPDTQKGNKRTKTMHHHHHHVHPHHHHHHHAHETTEAQPGPFNMLRFPSNPAPTQTAQLAHHHHHHHAAHAHPTHHHHHHTSRLAPAAHLASTTVLSKQVLDAIADKPRKHLGSQLYTTEVSMVAADDIPLDSKFRFKLNSAMRPIPSFEESVNCTYTVRVPRYYFTLSPDSAKAEAPSALEEISRRRQLWGTDIYTDDSDVVAAAIHSGWLKGDFGEDNKDLHELCDDGNADTEAGDTKATVTSLSARPLKPAKVPRDHDVHITILTCPPLESYASTNQHHILSRDWSRTHDGGSYMIHRIDFVDEGASTRYTERGVMARKQRIALEESRRREAAAGLLRMFANGTGAGQVRVGA